MNLELIKLIYEKNNKDLDATIYEIEDEFPSFMEDEAMEKYMNVSGEDLLPPDPFDSARGEMIYNEIKADLIADFVLDIVNE